MRTQGTRRVRLAVAALGLSVAVGVACGGGGATEAPKVPDDAVNAAQLQRGRTIYIANCSQCHGVAGGGGSGPKMTGGAVKRFFPKLDDQINQITNGGATMPAFGGKLSAEEIEAVSQYEREILNDE